MQSDSYPVSQVCRNWESDCTWDKKNQNNTKDRTSEPNILLKHLQTSYTSSTGRAGIIYRRILGMCILCTDEEHHRSVLYIVCIYEIYMWCLNCRSFYPILFLNISENSTKSFILYAQHASLKVL